MLQIQDRYRALKVIGQGGFGKIFLSKMLTKADYVTLKINCE